LSRVKSQESLKTVLFLPFYLRLQWNEIFGTDHLWIIDQLPDQIGVNDKDENYRTEF
jgi:hypothetical protein